MKTWKTVPLSELKLSDSGSFTALFSRFGVVDKQGDLTLPGAFGEQRVIISAYGHGSWEGALPVGKGRIFESDIGGIVEGQFFLETQAGAETYKTVKALGDLQEWSYALPEIDYEMRTEDGKTVRVLKKITVNEVSPVLMGAGVGTRTLDVKAAAETPEMKPYPNEHACRLEDPGKYDRFARKNCEEKSDGKCIDVIYGIKGGKSEIQALRYDKEVWSAAEARKHCASRGGSFEAAAKAEDEPEEKARKSLVDQLEAVAGDARKVVVRLQEVKDLRAADGRQPGAETMKRALALKAALEELASGLARLTVIAGDDSEAESKAMLAEAIRFALFSTARR